MRASTQPGLFDGPPAARVANPAPRLEPPERPPPAPVMSFSRLHRGWDDYYGDIRVVDIRAKLKLADDSIEVRTVGRLVQAVDEYEIDGWWVRSDDEEFKHILPVFDAVVGHRLPEAKHEVRACVAIWADPELDPHSFA